jgi:hypothetical protein
MKNFLKNWKTSLAGVLVAGLTFAVAKGYIDKDTYFLIFGILVSLGLINAKDGDQTGVAK